MRFWMAAIFLCTSVSAIAQSKLSEEELLFNIWPGSPSTAAFNKLRQMVASLPKGKAGQIEGTVWIGANGEADGLRTILLKICESKVPPNCIPGVIWNLDAMPTSQGGAVASITRVVYGRSAQDYGRLLKAGTQLWGSPDEVAEDPNNSVRKQVWWDKANDVSIWIGEGVNESYTDGTSFFMTLSIRNRPVVDVIFKSNQRWRKL